MLAVELHAHSAYSFLDGASLPEELAARAAELGYEALALTDHDGVYGSLEFAHAAKALGVRPITGAEVTLRDGSHVTLLVESAAGYANLCRLLTAAHAHTRDGPELAEPSLDQALLAELNDGPSASPAALGTAWPSATRTGRRRSRGRSGPSASSSSCSGPTSAATRGGWRRCATWRRRSACRPSRPATRMRITRAALRCRTCSSRSAAAPRSTAARRSGVATARASCWRRASGRSASRTTATQSRGRPSWRSDWNST